jgi:acyl-CoA synthetase (AMP-forming)/AMP-acid ligase II
MPWARRAPRRHRLRAALADAEPPGFHRAATLSGDDAPVLIYTSGTTGPPKGALIPHRALIGNLSGFVCSQNWFPQDDRGVLVARRLGLDRRPDGRAAAHAVLRPHHRRRTRAASRPRRPSS